MELLQLKYFAEAAECENFSRVAENHLLPQSAISHTIARLERELGVKLFDRQGKRVVLNSKGKLFYKRVSTALQNLDDGQKELCQSINIVRVKCYTGARLMPPIIKAFCDRHPDIDINLRQVYPNSENYDILIGVSGHKEENTVEYKLFDEEIMLGVSLSHALAVKSEVSICDLVNERIITVGSADNSAFANMIKELSEKKGIDLNYYIDTQDVYTAESYVENGFGVMFFPKITWGTEKNRRLRFLRVKDDGFVRGVSAFVKREDINSESIMRVKDYLEKSFANIN